VAQTPGIVVQSMKLNGIGSKSLPEDVSTLPFGSNSNGRRTNATRQDEVSVSRRDVMHVPYLHGASPQAIMTVNAAQCG